MIFDVELFNWLSRFTISSILMFGGLKSWGKDKRNGEELTLGK